MTTIAFMVFNACYRWHDCRSDTYAVVGMRRRYTTAFKCPIPTLSAQSITGSQGGGASQTSEQDRTSLVQ